MDVATLRSVPLFASLDSKATAELGKYLTIHDYPKSATIFRYGDPGDAMYLIDVGKVRISITDADGAVVTLAELGAGDFFGDMAMLDGQGRSANATAIEHARLAKLTRDDFLSFMRGDPRVTLELLTALTQRLRRTDELLRHRVSRNVNQEEALRMTFADRAADRIAEFGGSWKFIILSIVLFGVWVAANTILLTRRPFDPYPFILLNLALNMITALQAPIIMMSQNRQAHKDRLRANLDYQVNLKNELLLSDIIRRLDEIEKRKRE
ncbi:MAG: cyclic nucleotide-binding protein [Verrucomicrobia bacterium]|nr:MAG: cyclic nucleotide-binding protein [Verrucomicrobiota bacterium]PYL32375.1 MAG: cyclic nucleotide-binding protein [Verrucomicrobiota bacterium]PYL94919.1 MAG: cyclic nucleotide-binding protein [Verrucomicrobiota bacterium]